jgi:hypothetical protein
MAFDPVSIGILGGASLLSGIYQGKKEKEAREYAAKQEAEQSALERGMENMGRQREAQAASLQGLIEAYKTKMRR